MICTCILLLLFLVIGIHILIEKFSKCIHHENEENAFVENNEIEIEYLVDGYYFLSVTFVAFSVCALHYPPFDILPRRYELLFQNFSSLLADPIRMFLFYFKNPYLRQYLWSHIFRMSSIQIQPQINCDEMELSVVFE